jgi:hypothetical protein
VLKYSNNLTITYLYSFRVSGLVLFRVSGTVSYFLNKAWRTNLDYQIILYSPEIWCVGPYINNIQDFRDVIWNFQLISGYSYFISFYFIFGKTHLKGLFMGLDILEYNGNMHLKQISRLKFWNSSFRLSGRNYKQNLSFRSRSCRGYPNRAITRLWHDVNKTAYGT